ncbi:MAG: peptide chain release factor 2 [Candidatus Izimaplasma sp.]|nr:peptide chain release factor 2 [Candidatus Izimaplasma bacterium]
MQKSEFKMEFKDLTKLYEEVLSMTDLDSLNNEIKKLDLLTCNQDFWNDSKTAQKVVKELKVLKNKQTAILSIKRIYEELQIVYEFIQLEEDMEQEFLMLSNQLKEKAKKLSIDLLLIDEDDKLNAIIEIHPGAGGTESQDWAEMLFRMYKRYGEIGNYEFELLDYQSGDEAGLKSVTFTLRGDHAYGYLKSENGVHRLVRISPFDSGGRRHTSFAGVIIIPEIDDSVEVEINEKDLKIDTFRSSGAGGQSVNTTDSAVRITHLPTKLVVNVQNERSQFKNRDKAMKILKAKLYQLELKKKKEEISSYRSDSSLISFGSQIRSYVMHPYSMVKDHRTNMETSSVNKVLDGNITDFINGYLKMLAREEKH